jgi:hypothetical protein
VKNKNNVIPVPRTRHLTSEGIQGRANDLLAFLCRITVDIETLGKKASIEMEVITARYKGLLEPLLKEKDELEKGLISLMKKNKVVLFDGTDVINLLHGSLIHNLGDHVTIPKTALEACKQNKFNDVIKVVESLDRDKIEKWPDAKLVLIGAERKPKEEFKYTVKAKD